MACDRPLPSAAGPSPDRRFANRPTRAKLAGGVRVWTGRAGQSGGGRVSNVSNPPLHPCPLDTGALPSKTGRTGARPCAPTPGRVRTHPRSLPIRRSLLGRTRCARPLPSAAGPSPRRGFANRPCGERCAAAAFCRACTHEQHDIPCRVASGAGAGLTSSTTTGKNRRWTHLSRRPFWGGPE